VNPRGDICGIGVSTDAGFVGHRSTHLVDIVQCFSVSDENECWRHCEAGCRCFVMFDLSTLVPSLDDVLAGQ